MAAVFRQDLLEQRPVLQAIGHQGKTQHVGLVGAPGDRLREPGLRFLEAARVVVVPAERLGAVDRLRGLDHSFGPGKPFRLHGGGLGFREGRGEDLDVELGDQRIGIPRLVGDRLGLRELALLAERERVAFDGLRSAIPAHGLLEPVLSRGPVLLGVAVPAEECGVAGLPLLGDERLEAAQTQLAFTGSPVG